MAMYGIEAVRMNPANDCVDMLRWGRVDTKTNKWAGNTTDSDVLDVVDAIRRGNPAFTVFPQGAHLVTGLKLHVVVYPGGVNGVEVEDPERNPGRTVCDLPKF